MNDTLKNCAKAYLIEGLSKLPDTWQEKFKLMYGRLGGTRSVESACTMSVEKIVDEIPEERLDLAMQQVERSIESLKNKPAL